MKLLAPNGKPSNLTPEQYHLVRTPAFKAWFGDWENSPETASKVVDKNGEPLVVYHGTPQKEKFYEFNIVEGAEKKSKMQLLFGSHFASNLEDANIYTKTKGNVFEAFLNIKNILDLEEHYERSNPKFDMIYEIIKELKIDKKFKVSLDYTMFTNSGDYGGLSKEIQRVFLTQTMLDSYPPKKVFDVLKNKFDGIYYIPYQPQGFNSRTNFSKSFIAFEPNQIKLADGTNTTFDSNNPDIRYNNGGEFKDVVCSSCGWGWNKHESEEDDVYVCHKCGTDNNPAHKVYLKEEDFGFFKIYLGEKEVGYISYDFNKGLLEIISFFIKSEYRNKGIGTIARKKIVELLKPKEIRGSAVSKQSFKAVIKAFGKPYYMGSVFKQYDDIDDAMNYLPDYAKVDEIEEEIRAGESDGIYYTIKLADGGSMPNIHLKKGGSVNNLSKTPAPKKDRIYGSSKNKPKSSESKSKASSIILNPTVLKSINTILKEHNEDFPKKKVPLSTAKAVVRRGMGAFSSSYRPTISGGKPNSRVAWGLARLKAFVYKIQKGHSKSGKYKQDNDLIDELGYKHDEYKKGGELENDKTFILTTYFVSAETDTDSSHIYNGTDYERAKLEFDSANISDFDGGNGGMVLFQKVIDKYKFIGDLEDGYYEISDFPIEDYYNDKDYYKIIENGEFEHIDSKDVAHINNESDDLLHDVESYYQKTYGNWKYNKIIVDNGKDENDDDYKEYGCIQLRITNHSENVINNDKFGSCDYYISVVIANKNPTKEKFLTSMYERRRNEIELRFNSDNSFDEIIDEIDSEIANGKFYIAEKLDISVNDVYKNGGEMQIDDLYKDHHNVWAISEKIIKNVCEENCSKYSDEIHYLYELELKPHFIEEEKVFFPSVINENNKDLIKELIKEHHLIKFLAQKIKLSKKTKDIKDFCNLMIEHIKKEELIMKTISNDPYKKSFKNGGLTIKAPSQINKMPSFIAPNGERSNLISIKAEDENGRWVYLYDIVRTAAFKNWFGDWEEAYRTKDYEGVSKIIDENGEPSICYHVTSNEFYEFDENYIGSKTDSGYYGKGFYFTEGTADSHYGEREIPCFLNIRNPLSYKSINRTNVLDTNELKDKGYDGVLVFPDYVNVENIDLTKGLGYHGNNIQEIVAYYPEQIKLADATNRTFDKYDSDIRYKNGGNIPMREENIPMKEEEYKYFLVVKNQKPVFKVKFSKYKKETERDMSEMLDKLHDMNYSLKPITEQEYKDFDYGTVDKEDIAEFTKNWSYYKEGGVITNEQEETYNKWKKLVNMTASELKKFLDSDEGKVAGLTSKEADKLGIDYGRESAKWILKMKAIPYKEWTPNMWRWAKKQISFISRMSGNKGKLFDENGKRTRKYLSLLVWGNNPLKK